MTRRRIPCRTHPPPKSATPPIRHAVHVVHALRRRRPPLDETKRNYRARWNPVCRCIDEKCPRNKNASRCARCAECPMHLPDAEAELKETPNYQTPSVQMEETLPRENLEEFSSPSALAGAKINVATRPHQVCYLLLAALGMVMATGLQQWLAASCGVGSHVSSHRPSRWG